MKTMKMSTQKIHVLKFEKGDELLTGVLAYVKNNNIVAGYLFGIGALEKGEISYFNTNNKKYQNFTFKEVELLSCQGNISVNKETNQPIVHIHLVIGEENGKAIGGHLVTAIVSVTAEIFLVETRPAIYRIKDEETGLYLLNPKD